MTQNVQQLPTDIQKAAEKAMGLLGQLARCSEPGEGVTRLPFTVHHENALVLIEHAMHEAGLHTHRDAAGTLIGRREAAGASADGKAQTLLLGSHQDSIVNGGAYDGILGVVLPIVALQLLFRTDLPFAVEVLCFADEEGVRFPTALMGPRCLAGTFDSAALSLCDHAGVSLQQALADFGGDPNALQTLRRDRNDVLAYLELHIEQGPVLEACELPVGVVTGICGIERWSVCITGKSAHAGTTPMDMRKDALAAAAELVLALETLCRDTPDLVGVVGELEVRPGVVNAVPGQVNLTVELRAADDTLREQAAKQLWTQFEQMIAARSLCFTADRNYQQGGVKCDDALQQLLATSIERTGVEPRRLMSGATHDASAMSDLCPVAMLFLQCKGGVSHHPDESVTVEDCGYAIAVLKEAIMRLR